MAEVPSPSTILQEALSLCALLRWRSLRSLAGGIVDKPSDEWQESSVHARLACLLCTVAFRRDPRFRADAHFHRIASFGAKHVPLHARLKVEISFYYLCAAERHVHQGSLAAARHDLESFHEELAGLNPMIGDTGSAYVLELYEEQRLHLLDRLAFQIVIAQRVRMGELAPAVTFLLGMHRSGTSALAGLLYRHGFSAPKDPMPANNGNPKGYNESLGVAHLNDELFAEFDSSWNSVEPLPEDWAQTKQAQDWRIHLMEHICREFDAAEHPLIKDPRLCLLIPGLTGWLESASCEVTVILQLRHPYECAHSISQLRGVSLSDGIKMWARHVATAEKATRGLRRIICTYDRLLEQPAEVASSISSFILASGSGFARIPSTSV